MAVKEESLHHATENLILQTPRKYYRVKIDTNHWQLRSLISSPEQDIIYFPNGADIISIKTKTRERELIASLTFLPRCLVASKDWLCCGGDNGNYTAISLKDRLPDFDPISFLNADPDPRLPLDLDPPLRSRHQTQIGEMIDAYRRLRSGRARTTQNETIGPEIVNCITLWSPSAGLSERVHNLPVAVVSNNDRTVSILNVATSETLQTLKLPDFVNRTAISPNGELMVSVCDDPFLYIHERKLKSRSKRETCENKDVVYEWVLAQRIQLDGQRPSDRSQMRGSFALSFSKSGRYLAVATQYGIISIFDAECLTDMHSMLVTFTSSRPGRPPGAVRAMEFSPGPFDLLAWTEASGRVGVADVRTLFISRQLILINTSEHSTERITLSDRSSQRLGLRNLRTGSPHSSTPDYLDLDAEVRRRNLTREMLLGDNEPPTQAELDVLEVSRIARRQRDAANEAREVLAEASATSRWGPWTEGRRPILIPGPDQPSRLVSNSGLPASLRDFVAHEGQASSFRDFLDERNRASVIEQNREAVRRSEANQAEARQRRAPANQIGEVDTRDIVQNDESVSSASALDRLTLAALPQEASNRRDPPPAPPPAAPANSSRAPESNTPWTDIESIYRATLQADPLVNRATRVRVEIGNEDGEQTIRIDPREFAHRLRQPWNPTDDADITIERRRTRIGTSTRDESGLLDGVLRGAETMGLCWSPDGRILYAATLEGIHEYHVNVQGRKMFPSIVFQ
ncbi:uncharacterized protein RSE6_09856 [Rhynchosporium secalis]|uniref:DUF2415 domain-containing protein n=1 Tax=Rhynchosporium secalis TaxID=38038 RepID=A0A1E1MIZ6_RHYSE|nr:uncharacterized protein RSE6_09856 [Rhynchosporium secalis]